MDYSKNSTSNLALFSLLLVSVLYFCILTPTPLKPIFSIQNQPCPQSNFLQRASRDELEAALVEASMPNKTVIIAVVNKAYVEPHDDTSPAMFDLFIQSFWLGEGTRSLLDHLLLVAVDQTAYDRCKFRRLHCYRLATEGVDFTGEKLYLSDDFIKMMWRRTRFLLDVLKRGYNFIFTDTDVMWLRNPLPRLSKNESDDLQLSTDWFKGNPWSKKTSINTGFYYIRSNTKTIALFKRWYGMKDNSAGMKEQDVLVTLIRKGVCQELGVGVRLLDTVYFSGFCSVSEDIRVVATVHANCCRGISAKVADLMAVLHDWKRFKESADHENAMKCPNGTEAFQWSKFGACINSWKISK